MKDTKEQIDLDAIAASLANEVSNGRCLTGNGGLMKDLMKKVIEASLEAEMEEHLSEKGKSSKNRRNGRGRKNILSSSGGLEIFAPRDRDGSFEPQIIKKRQRRLDNGIDNKILSLYGKGLSYRDIQDHLRDIYEVDLSVGTLNAITDKILPEILEWQQRPLETVYPVMWLDAMHFKVREHGKVVTKAVYNILGVNRDGDKQVLGIYFGDHESSTFWRSVLHELRQRGVQDIFVACIDNLSGFGDAIEDIFPKTDVQLCLVHQMRNSIKYASHKDVKPLIKDLRAIYTALNEDQALQYLKQAEDKWGAKYKAIFRSWNNNWNRLINFYKYPPALRRVIYNNNPIESYHRMVRKVTKTKGAFTSENAIVKQLYLATLNAETRWNGRMFAWTSVRRDLVDYFENRFLTDDTLN